jgi:hypothetical protein
MGIKYIKLLWRIAFVRLALYVLVTVGTAFSIATYNVGFFSMNGEQHLALAVSLAILAAKDIISFLDSSAKRIEAGNYLPPDPPETQEQKAQIQAQKPLDAGPIVVVNSQTEAPKPAETVKPL